MVIQVINTTASDATIGGIVFNQDSTHILPADRCTWTYGYNPTSRQYQISNVNFFSTETTDLIGTIPNTFDSQLGYIGKSGRFVAIAE